MGNGEVIRPGEWQKMTAGTGIRHSEFNPSDDGPGPPAADLDRPGREGADPGYEQKLFPDEEKRGRWRTVASPDGRDGSIVVHQDVMLSATMLKPGETVRYDLAPGRGAWLHVATGAATVKGSELAAGDAVAVEGEPRVEVVGRRTARCCCSTSRSAARRRPDRPGGLPTNANIRKASVFPTAIARRL